MGEAYTKPSGTWVREIEALLEREGMPAELPQEEHVEYLDTVGAERIAAESDEVTEDELPEADGPVGRVSPVLTSCEHAVLSLIRERGYAATLSEARAPDEQIGRLADAGLAYLKTDGREVVVAMAGATDGDVRRAANWARSDEIGALFEETVAVCERVAQALVARTRRLGGACSEAGLYGSLAASPWLCRAAGAPSRKVERSCHVFRREDGSVCLVRREVVWGRHWCTPRFRKRGIRLVLDCWREVCGWWEPSGGTDRLCFSVLASGGVILDLAFERNAGEAGEPRWLVTKVVD